MRVFLHRDFKSIRHFIKKNSYWSDKITSILLKFGWSSCEGNVKKAKSSKELQICHRSILDNSIIIFQSHLKDLGKNKKYFKVLALWCVKIKFSKFMNFSLNFDQNWGPLFKKVLDVFSSTENAKNRFKLPSDGFQSILFIWKKLTKKQNYCNISPEVNQTDSGQMKTNHSGTKHCAHTIYHQRQNTTTIKT